ncbi:MAG: DNA-methyltransferase [Candidatus Puniceispirillaceae bacterium]
MRQFPSAHFRVIVTSPPYNLRNSSGHGLRDGRGGKWHNAALLQGYDQYDDCMSNDDYVAWQRLCLGEMMRLLRQDGAIFYNHKWRVQNGLLQDRHDIVSPFPVRQIIIWHRSGGINFNSGYFLPNYEVIYLITKPKFRLAPKANAQGCVWRINQEVDNSHPAPFPVALAERCISAVAKGLVLDPFIGSGSTAIAAEKLKRPWVGIEQSANYVSMAARRIGKMRDIIDDPQTPPA